MLVEDIRMNNIRKIYEKLISDVKSAGITINELGVPHFGHRLQNYYNDIRTITNNAEYNAACVINPEIKEDVQKILGLIGEAKRNEGEGIDIR